MDSEVSRPAYVIIRINIFDAQAIRAYQSQVPAIVTQYQGRFLARGGQLVTLEGCEETRRVVIIVFPSLSLAQAFYHPEEYRAAMNLRQGIAEAEIIALEGIA